MDIIMKKKIIITISIILGIIIISTTSIIAFTIKTTISTTNKAIALGEELGLGRTQEKKVLKFIDLLNNKDIDGIYDMFSLDVQDNSMNLRENIEKMIDLVGDNITADIYRRSDNGVSYGDYASEVLSVHLNSEKGEFNFGFNFHFRPGFGPGNPERYGLHKVIIVVKGTNQDLYSTDSTSADMGIMLPAKLE